MPFCSMTGALSCTACEFARLMALAAMLPPPSPSTTLARRLCTRARKKRCAAMVIFVPGASVVQRPHL